MSNLKEKAISSAKWTAIASIFSTLSGPVYKIVLGMLLVTKDFAYLSVITLINKLAEMIGDIGIGKSLIKRKGIDNAEFTVALIIKVSMSILIGVILFLISKPMEKFYGYTDLSKLIKLTTITIIISSINNVCSNVLQKELLFKEYSLSNIIRNLSDMISSIIFIVLGLGITGFVYGTITGIFICTLMNIIVIIKKTKFRLIKNFKINNIKDFFGFGIVISVKDILTYIVGKLDEIIVGKLLGQEVLGIYFFGKDFVKKPQELISSALTQALFPILVQVKDDKNKLKDWYMKISKYMAFIAFPIFMGLAITSDFYIKILYKGKWDSSIGVIKVFCIIALFTILTANIATSTLYTLDKQKKVLLIDIVTNTLYLMILFFSAFKSLYIIMIMYMIYTIIKCIWLQNEVGNALTYKWIVYLKELSIPAIASLIMIIGIIIVNCFFKSNLSLIITFILDITIGIIIYILIIYIFDKKIIQEIKEIILKRK